MSEVPDKPLAVKVNDHTVTCDYLVIATHVPLMGKAGLVGAPCSRRSCTLYELCDRAKVPKGTVPQALFWDTV